MPGPIQRETPKLNYAGRAFTDRDLDELPVRPVVYPYEEVDFSQNNLSVAGMRKVMELCRRCENLRVLKLYKNDIDDGGAAMIAKLLEECGTIEEIHLSHNRFSSYGVGLIVGAADWARPKGAYPLWLRLEKNWVEDPERAMRDMQQNFSVCFRKDRQRCTVRHCVNNCKVHLPHFHIQRTESAGGGKSKSKGFAGWEDDGGGAWNEASWKRADRWDHADTRGRGQKRWRDGCDEDGEDGFDAGAQTGRGGRHPVSAPIWVDSDDGEAPSAANLSRRAEKPRMNIGISSFIRAVGDAHASVRDYDVAARKRRRVGGVG